MRAALLPLRSNDLFCAALKGKDDMEFRNGDDIYGDPNETDEQEIAIAAWDNAHRDHETRPCPDCRGTGLNYLDPDDGGSCPSCITLRMMF